MLTKVSFSMINGDVLNVLDYGADPSGVTDSSAAIQAAITAANASNATVFFPEGNYLYQPAATFSFTINSNSLTLAGIPGRSVITTDFNGIVFNVTTVTGTTLGPTGLNVRDLNFVNKDYNTTNTNATCFYISNGVNFGAYFNFSFCVFGRYTVCAIKGIRAFNSTIKNCEFYGVAFRDGVSPFPATELESGICLYGADGTLTVQDHSFSNACLIENCFFNYLYIGVDIWGSDRTNKIVGCTFQASTMGVQIKGDSTINGTGSAATFAGFSVAEVTIDNCWFELIWKAFVGNIVNSVSGLIYAAGAYGPLPNTTQGIVHGGLNNYYGSNTIVPANSFAPISVYAPVTEGVVGSGTVAKYFYGQTASANHYRLYSNECFLQPPVEMESGFHSKAASQITNTSNATLLKLNTPVGYVGSAFESLSQAPATFTWWHEYHTSAGSTQVFGVGGDGRVLNLTGVYSTISDVKLKENITPAPSYWDKFKRYQFVNYTLKANPEAGKQLGLIAQQAEEVSPGVVFDTEDTELVETGADENGNPIYERKGVGTYTKAIKYSIVALQAEIVLQEAMARIEKLEAEIAALKTQ